MSTASIIQVTDCRQPYSIALVRLDEAFMPQMPEVKVYPPGQEPEDAEKPEMPEMPFVVLRRAVEEHVSPVSGLKYTIYDVYVGPNPGEDEKPTIESEDELVAWLEDVTKGMEWKGSIMLPHRMRDGLHQQFYIVAGIPEQKFTFQTTNGMYEEVVWAETPAGQELVDAADAQELANYRISPQLWRNMDPDEARHIIEQAGGA